MAKLEGQELAGHLDDLRYGEGRRDRAEEYDRRIALEEMLEDALEIAKLPLPNLTIESDPTPLDEFYSLMNREPPEYLRGSDEPMPGLLAAQSTVRIKEKRDKIVNRYRGVK